jgi:hypothetical protein
MKMAGRGGPSEPGLGDRDMIWVEDEHGENEHVEVATPKPPPLVERGTPEPVTPAIVAEQDQTPERVTEEDPTPEVVVVDPSTRGKPPPPAGFGELRVDAEPWATVMIGGRSYGETPVKAKLPVGAHVIELQCFGSGAVDTHNVAISLNKVTPYYRVFPADLCP